MNFLLRCLPVLAAVHIVGGMIMGFFMVDSGKLAFGLLCVVLGFPFLIFEIPAVLIGMASLKASQSKKVQILVSIGGIILALALGGATWIDVIQSRPRADESLGMAIVILVGACIMVAFHWLSDPNKQKLTEQVAAPDGE